MKTIELSTGAKVDLIEKLTWGQREQVRSALYSGVSMNAEIANNPDKLSVSASALVEAKFKAIEVCVKNITEPDGTQHGFSREWMDALSIEDGDKVVEAVDEVTQPGKA